MNKIFIEEDIIDEDYSHYLYHRFTRDVEWKMNQNHPYSEYEPRGYEQGLILSENFNSFPIYTSNHMSHKIIDVEKEMTFGDNVSWKFLDVIPILHNFQKSKNFEFNYKIVNIDCSLKYKQDIKLKDSVNQPHFNFYHEHGYTVVYFVNDSDGDLIIYNEKFQNKPNDKLTIWKKITPKRGTVVVFPSNTLHSHNFPVKNPFKITINFNFIYND